MEEKIKLIPEVQDFIRYIAREYEGNLDDYFEMWGRIYSPRDFEKILRLVGLERRTHLRVVE